MWETAKRHGVRMQKKHSWETAAWVNLRKYKWKCGLVPDGGGPRTFYTTVKRSETYSFTLTNMVM